MESVRTLKVLMLISATLMMVGVTVLIIMHINKTRDYQEREAGHVGLVSSHVLEIVKITKREEENTRNAQKLKENSFRDVMPNLDDSQPDDTLEPEASPTEAIASPRVMFPDSDDSLNIAIGGFGLLRPSLVIFGPEFCKTSEKYNPVKKRCERKL